MTIFAHRGASIEFPENTLAAFRRAVELGAPGVELDVHLSKDGVPIVIHDESVDRTTNATGAVRDLTASELGALDAGSGEKVPTLAEVLDVLSGHLVVDIEVKTPEAASAVLELVANYPDLKWLISSFYWDALRFVRSRDANAELWVLWPSATEDAIACGVEIGATLLNLQYDSVTALDVSKVRDAGMEIGVWTVNDVKVAEKLRDLGVVAICTDDPASLANVYG